MADIIDEIINEDKDEKRQYYFLKILPYVIYCTIFVAISMISYNYYIGKKQAYNQQLGDLLLGIVADKNKQVEIEQAGKILLDENQTSNIRQLAQLFANSWDENRTQNHQKRIKLQQIALDDNNLPLTQDIAQISHLANFIESGEVLDIEQQQLEALFKHFDDQTTLFHQQAKLYKIMHMTNRTNSDVQKEKIKVEIGQILQDPNYLPAIKTYATAILYKVESGK